MTTLMNVLCVVMCSSLFLSGIADRESADDLELEKDVQLNAASDSEGRYCIPNYLKNGGGEMGIPAGATVTVLRQGDSSMNHWTHGQRGIVLGDFEFAGEIKKGLEADIAEGGLQGDVGICYFGGAIYFPDFPNKRLGQGNRPLDHEDKIWGLNLIQWEVTDVVLKPENIEKDIEKGYTGVLGGQLDPIFLKEVLTEIFEPLKADEFVPDSKVVSPITPLLTKFELLEEIKEFDLIPDSHIRVPILTAVDAMLKEDAMIPDSHVRAPMLTADDAMLTEDAMIPDAVIWAPLPELHIIPVGELAKPAEIILDSIVRVVAKPVTPPNQSFKDGTEVRHYCVGQSKGSKVLVMGCCWELCRKTFEIETSQKVNECINQCKSAE